ncbi:rhomboid family protein [Lysobacter capsici]|uniref:rhomboid family intramembrane serine protease n=1 Tax=Lysobacter capsici TaxID=435897 RepID=UPI000716440D|nr:rhomboid family intramembrane serine protease [Lysobacter capsici]ALN83390.1 rhomboid family protein [Lysobacter capsici]ATE69966.1 rhomboid family intramembrane serine protease [Lysobacter capsici]
MQLPTEAPVPDTPAQRKADRRRLLRALNASLAFVLLLVAVFAAQSSFDVRAFTVQPWSLHGLIGLLTAPLLHGSVEHLAANATSLLLLGTLAGAVYPKATVRALPIVWIGSGVGAWLLGDPGSYHLGASGVTHGLMFLVMTLGLLRRDRPSIAAAMIAFLLYGGMLLTVLPREIGVSWQAHLGGAVAGVIAAFVFRLRDPLPPRKRYSWEDEDESMVPAHEELEPPSPREVPVLWNRPEHQTGVVLRFPPRNGQEE